MHWKLLIGVIAAALVIAACGGGDDDDTDPAETGVASSTPAASPPADTGGAQTAPPAGPTGTPGPALDPGLFEVLNYVSYQTSSGLYFAGEVRNNSDKNAIIVVRVSLIGEAGDEVGNGEDRLQAQPYTPPGATMAFKMSIAGAPQSWLSESFTLSGREATEADIARVYDDFEFRGTGVVQAEQGVTVQGIIKNSGTVDMNPIKITFIARDANQRVIGAWGANPPGLVAGAETVFGFPVLDVPVPPPSYDILAYGYLP